MAKYKGVEHLCTVEADEEGKLAFVVDDKSYSSPSSAGSAVMGGTACNGWPCGFGLHKERRIR